MTGLALPGLGTPTHIAEKTQPGKPLGYTGRSLCGIKDALPIVGASFVQAHVDGYGMVVCPDCAARTSS